MTVARCSCRSIRRDPTRVKDCATSKVFRSVGRGGRDEVAVDGNPVTALEVRRLRQALIARYGVELGSEASSSAVTWAYEHRDRLATIENRVGYLFRVGMSATRAQVRWQNRTVRRDVDRLVEAQFPDVDLYRAHLIVHPH